MKPIARNKNLVVQQADDELLIYDLDTNKAICLNRTSAFIWENCDGKKSFQGIAEVVEKKFGELVSEDFVKFAVDQLKKENLIDNKDEVVTGFSGMSRREVIKRVGLGSMIALPIVASLTAPTVSHAASFCTAGGAGGLGDACTCPMGTPADSSCGQQTCKAGCNCIATQNGDGAGTCG